MTNTGTFKCTDVFVPERSHKGQTFTPGHWPRTSCTCRPTSTYFHHTFTSECNYLSLLV